MPIPQKIKVVLDTNCLIASLSRKGRYYKVWKGLQEGRYILCVSNEIINEYLEIIGRKINSFIAENVVQLLVNCEFVELHDPSFHFYKIKSDPEDNKFVDCAIASNAICIVSNDRHFDEAKGDDFPQVTILTIAEFMNWLFKQ